MDVKGTKVLHNGGKTAVDVKRKREGHLEYEYALNPCVKKSPSNLAKNYFNFTNSLLPCRVLFFEGGEWNDFPERVVDLVQEGFKIKKAVFEVEFRGGPSLLDFLLMVMVGVSTGFSRAIAWIDIAGKCHFPVNEDYCVCDCSPSPPVCSEQRWEEQKRFKTESNPGRSASEAVQHVLIKDNIQDTTGCMAKDRLAQLEKELETTGKWSTNVNVPYAWLCTSGDLVSNTMVHEPWFIEQPKPESNIGIDLDPSHSADSSSSSHTRASYYDDDENSIDEELSSITSISSVDSSGVYEQTRDPVNASKDENTTSKFTGRSPTQIKMSFSTLFAAIEDKISYRAMKSLYEFYDDHKNNKISRDEFVQRIKQTVRDDTFLLTAITNLQRKQALATGG